MTLCVLLFGVCCGAIIWLFVRDERGARTPDERVSVPVYRLRPKPPPLKNIEALLYDGSPVSAAAIMAWTASNPPHWATAKWKVYTRPHPLNAKRPSDRQVIELCLPTEFGGDYHAGPGDYVVRHTDGEYYPVSKAMFAAQFELTK